MIKLTPSPCNTITTYYKKIPHSAWVFGLWGALLGNSGLTWATCVQTPPATVTCSGVPTPTTFLNDFASAANNLTVHILPGTQMNSIIGEVALSLTGNGITVNNSGTVDPAVLGQVSVLSSGMVIGNATTSSEVLVNTSSTSIIRGTAGTLVASNNALNGLAVNIQNGTGGTTTLINDGTISSTALFNTSVIASDALLAAFSGGAAAIVNNNGVITGRMSFAPSASGNLFRNTGTINGSIYLGTGSTNTFTAVTGSSISPDGGSGAETTGTGGLIFAATGTINGGAAGTNTLLLENTAGAGGGAAGAGTASSDNYVNFATLNILSGTWTLQGPLVSGSTTLSGGVASFNDNATFGSGTLTSNGGTIQASNAGLNLSNTVTLGAGGLTVQATNAFTLSGNIGGSGGLIKGGPSTLSLTGNNSYSGTTSLNSGGLVVGNANALGVGALTVNDSSQLNNLNPVSLNNAISLNATLAIGGSSDLTLTNTISGAGGLIKNGTSDLSLSGNNSYFGATALNTGRLIVGNSNALGSGALNAAGGTQIDSSTAVSLANAINLPGVFTIAGTNELTLAGIINGAGSLVKNGAAKLILNGVNTYLGDTTINNGSLIIGDIGNPLASVLANVQVKTGGILGGYGTVGGNVTVDANGHLAPGNSIGTLKVNNNLILNTGSILDFEFASVGIGDNVSVGGDLTIDGSTLNITALSGFGPGVYNLFTYGGALLNAAITLGTTPGGTYQIQNLTTDKEINLVNTAGLTLQFWNANNLASPTQSGGGSGTWSTTSFVWTDALGTITAAMQPQPGFAIFGGAPGTVTVDNSSGQTSALGMQLTSDGYVLTGNPLELMNGGTAPEIRVGDNSALSPTFTATINNIIIGSNGLNKTGEGRLILNGANTYTGSTLLSAGVLSVSNDNNLGNSTNSLDFAGGTLQNTANVTMNRSVNLGAAGGTFLTDTTTTSQQNGAISGSGALTKNGSGTLILNNALNSYTGGTVVNSGSLQAATANALVNNTAYTINGGVLDLNNFNLSISSLAGTGGTVAVGTATLTDNQAINSTYAGAITGSNQFVKQGAGALMLTGDSSTFTGNTQVDAGILQIDGTLGGSLLVNSNGRLQGIGTVGDTTVSGTITPGTGASAQTLNIAGNYIQNSGSTYEATVDPAGQASLIQVAGNAQLNGGNVNVTAANGIYSLQKYTILNATGTVSGTYNSLSQNLPFINFALSYDNQNVFLDVAQSDVTFPSAAVTANQLAVAQAIDSLGAGNALFNTVLSLPSLQAARDAFNSLSGEVYATTIGSLIDAGHYVEDTMLNRMTTPALVYEEVRNAKNVWAQGVGSWGHRDGNSDTAKVTNSGGGLFIGSDVNTDTSRLGIMAGYSSLQNNIAARQSKMSTNNYHLGVYAAQSLGQLVFRAGGAYSWHDVDTHRAVVFPGLSELLKSDYNANSTQAFIESGYALGQNSWQLEPFVRGSASHVSTDSFQEQGGIAALNSRKNQESIYFSTLGGRLYKTFKEEKQYILKGRTLLGWRHAFNDINPLATLAFDTSIPFTIAGSPIARNGLVIDAGIDALLTNKALTLTLSYTGQVASNVQDHGIRGVLAWRFS